MAKSYKKRYEELMEKLNEIEAQSSQLQRMLQGIMHAHMLEYIIEDVKKGIESGQIQRISIPWLQRKYRIGYARASMISDTLEDMGLVRSRNRGKIVLR